MLLRGARSNLAYAQLLRAVEGEDAALTAMGAAGGAQPVIGGALLARLWGTEVLEPQEMRAFLTNVRMPTTNASEVARVSDSLMAQHGTWVPCFSGEGKGLPADSFWCRVSAQVYLDLADFERLGRTVLAILAEGR